MQNYIEIMKNWHNNKLEFNISMDVSDNLIGFDERQMMMATMNEWEQKYGIEINN